MTTTPTNTLYPASTPPRLPIRCRLSIGIYSKKKPLQQILPTCRLRDRLSSGSLIILLSILSLLFLIQSAYTEESYDTLAQKARAYLQAGQEAHRQKEYRKAYAHFSEALRLQPKIATGYESRALAALQLGRFDQAQEDLSAAITLSPRDPKLYYYRGAIYMEEERFLLAIEDYTRWITLAPVDGRPHFYRGNAYLRISESKKAIEDFSAVLFHQPSNEQAYYHRGVMKALLGDHAAARSDFTQAIRINKFLSEGFLARAVSSLQLKDYDLALKDAKQAIHLRPLYAKAYIVESQILRAQENRAEAKAILLKALEVDPLHAPIYIELAGLTDEDSDTLTKRQYYLSGIKLLSAEIMHALFLGERVNPQHYYERAGLHERLGNSEAATKDYKKARRLYAKRGDREYLRRIDRKLATLKAAPPPATQPPQ